MASRRIFISVAEDSADVHAASLVRRAREMLPGYEFLGLTGPRLRAEGVETVYDFAAHAAMLTGVFGVIRQAREALAALEASWETKRPAALVLLDSPELHLRIAARAKRAGIPVLYYIAPQTWASRAYRNRQIARVVDRLACILPFEEGYFRTARVRAEYVGHPLLEALDRAQTNPVHIRALRDGGAPLVAILPGSRKHVIQAMLPHQLAVIQHMLDAGVGVRAAVSCISPEREGLVRDLIDRSSVPAQVIVNDNASLLTAADVVLVNSGTATLHVAYYGKPMIVMYHAGSLMGTLNRLVGRWIVTTPHLSLVNILAGRRIVPEFMPAVRDTAGIARICEQLLSDHQWRSLMTDDIRSVVAGLGTRSASARVCELLRELVEN